MKLFHGRKRSGTVLPVIITVLLFAAGAMIINYNRNPQVRTAVTLSGISEEEYFGLNNSKYYDYHDLKKLIVQVDIKNTPNYRFREIRIPDLLKIDRIDEIRSLKMFQREENNTGYNYAQSYQFIVFDSTGLTAEDVKRIYADDIIEVEIITHSGDKILNKYSIGDLLTEKETKEEAGS